MRKSCWFWQHEYKLDLDTTDKYNETALYTYGSKIYFCTKCGKGKIIWPKDCF